MKRAWLAAVVAFGGAVYFLAQQPSVPTGPARTTQQPSAVSDAQDSTLARAFAARRSNLQVTAEGVVMTRLADDNSGSRHQRFILELASGQTVLVAHNIDLADRIDGLRVGDRVSIHGEYEWNERGGVVHWTHRDPRGTHAPGWIKHQGRTYQ